MDTMRNFGSGRDDIDETGVDHPGVEAPPQIGTDERRMHVRAYNFWAQMLGDRSYPAIESLDVGNLSDFGSHAVLLDFTAGIDDPGIAFVGDALRVECQLPDAITRISDVPGRSLLSRLTDHYLQIIANQAPIGFEAEFVNDRGVNILYRGILLPFSSDNETIDFILGVINWKQVADQTLIDGLRDEVDASIRHAASPSAVVPSWADGPNADDSSVADDPSDGTDGFGEHADFGAVSDGFGDDDQDADDEEPPANAGLAYWLSLARDTAETAKSADVRSRGALYRAISRAYDFSLVAAERPADYRDMLEDAGIVGQDRAPMTPVVKLVFGADYDKTRLTEYAAALNHGHHAGVARGDLGTYLSAYRGGLKQLVRDARAGRSGADADARQSALDKARLAMRAAPAFGIADYKGEDSEFVLLIGRRATKGRIEVVGAVENARSLLDRAMLKTSAARQG